MAFNPHEKEGYKYPKSTLIGISDETVRLYNEEEAVIETIKSAAKELQKLSKYDTDYTDFWKGCVPQELFTVLESFDSKASDLAAISYLEERGYCVTKEKA
jgi:hypothetical protein